KLVLPEKIKTSSGKETNLIRVENVKNITEYIDRIDEMIERKEALFEKD
ncbi:MAG: coproporphyrinogen dehydrogenase HemZ, partial [Anaerobutyricum sp.]